MGNFRDKGRDRKPASRPGSHGRQRKAILDMERLEVRTLMAVPGSAAPTWVPTSSNLGDVQNGPLAKGGQDLVKIYQEYLAYEQAGDLSKPFQSSLASRIEFSGTEVGVDISVYGSVTNYASLVASMGMQVQHTDTPTGIVEGLLPLSELPAVAELSTTVGLLPIYDVKIDSVGVATNEGEKVLGADIAKTQYNVNGAGQTVGVLSDSANQYNGGLAASVATGDLPANVQVLQDGPAGSTDEGRAMLEEIHDIATGAALQFATAGGGEVAYASNIRALAAAGSTVIVDDAHYPTEPYYQDGVVAQAVDSVVQTNGVTYVSSAGNAANSGYQSNFRGANGTVTGIGAGRFMNFDPNGGTALTIGMEVYNPSNITFQFDQPTYTTNGVTSNVNIFVLDANNNIVTSGASNTIATQTPIQLLGTVAPGLYKVAIQVISGPDVGHVSFYEQGDGGFSIDDQYGGAGGTTYGQVNGHHGAAETIATGAVPWFNSPPYYSAANYYNEPFSAFGPVLSVFNPDGTRKAAPQQLLKPDVSAPDGIDTSFFSPGNTISTLNVPFPQSSVTPYPGNPASVTGEMNTPTELDGNANPNFFGTSAAAPNIAAVVALMKQYSPGSSRDQILAALEQSTIPLDGTKAGQWGPQSGYGLPQTAAALGILAQLQVVSTTPALGQVVTTTPSSIVVTFNQAVNPASLSAADLVFVSSTVAGDSFTVGQPVISSADGKTVTFPITFTHPAGGTANAAYAFSIRAGSITSTAGKPVLAYNSYFVLNDVTAPRVANVGVNGRIVTVAFNKALDATTISKNAIYLVRTGASGVFNNPTNVILNTDPRLVITYNPVTFTITLDFSQFDQTELPSDIYALVALDTITDQVGNRLDGEFSGVFPSGNGTAGGTFSEILGDLILGPPQILTLSLAPASDTGIAGDQNTDQTRPSFVGQVKATFPGTAAGLTVVAEFNAYHSGTLDLGLGAGSPARGFVGSFDVQATTDANGNFTFQAPSNLPGGFITLRVVVIGASNAPPLPGYSASVDTTFRVDLNSPIISTDANSIQQDQDISSLTSLVLDATDPVQPNDLGDPLGIPTQFSVPALDPATADNISNYALYDRGVNGVLGAAGQIDESSFITSATFVQGAARISPSDPFTGTVALTFAPGLPAGTYVLVAKSPLDMGTGLTDAAGNGAYSYTPAGGLTPTSFNLTFNLQSSPVFVTQLNAVTFNDPYNTDTNGNAQTTLSPPRSYFEIASPGDAPRASAPPTEFDIYFSQSLRVTSPTTGLPVDYSKDVELIRSADSASSAPDGDFGTDPSFTSGVGYSLVSGLSVQLVNSVLGATPNTPGYKDKLVVTLPAGTSLAADHYRFFLPNDVSPDGTTDTRVYDIYGNQLDGEFLGNPSPTSTVPSLLGASKPVTYENLLSTGAIRENDLSGDGTPGGSFETSYIVVPNGNILYARPDYNEDPYLSTTLADGSLAHPFPVLAPEATSNSLNGGDLNSVANFGTGFNSQYDRSGNGRFDLSAFYAADQAAANGPVVIVALPSVTDPSRTFVLQAPSGSNPIINDGSATVPNDTDLVFAPGSVLKLQNASLYVQQQGSSIQVDGGANPSQQVTFTSYSDNSVGGQTGGNPTAVPQGGDWGGIVLRNFDDVSNGGRAIPEAAGPADSLHSSLGISGADDALSYFNFANIRYAGGAVPQTIGFRYDAITNFNSRPLIANVSISQVGSVNSPQAAISVDVDSEREDNLTRGVTVRRATLQNNSLNGIYIRANLNGIAEPTDAIDYVTNVTTGAQSLGGQQNYTFFAPVPYILVSNMDLGQTLLDDTNGTTTSNLDRYYFQPGTVVKFQRGSSIEVLNPTRVTPGPSLVIGSRAYIHQFDVNNNVAPTDAGFVAPSDTDAPVLFTSLYDDVATTVYTDPTTGNPTTVVAPLSAVPGGAGVLQPSYNSTTGVATVPDLARWGGISVMSGAIAAINDATFKYGGGSVNTGAGTNPQRDVLFFTEPNNTFGQFGLDQYGQAIVTPLGTTAYITNNSFIGNSQAAIGIDPEGLLAADPLRPLESGNPFFRGNILLGNDLNGMEVLPIEYAQPGDTANVYVDTVWSNTDLTYILRKPIILGGGERSSLPVPGSGFVAEQVPSITLTIQSALPGTLLANGQTIAQPGESMVVKLYNNGSAPVGNAATGSQGLQSNGGNGYGGASFLIGVDNITDPGADILEDPGYFSEFRITGIPANQTTGQQRIPVVITSLFDNTEGRTVRGVGQFVSSSNTTQAPAAGDGGVIDYGALSESDYNLYDPRDGSVIDNADIKYLTRIEQQGGGWVYPGIGSNRQVKLGITAATQLNTAKAMTVSDSNLSNFSQDGWIAHPSYANQLDVLAINGFAAVGRDTAGLQGQPTLTYFVNDTFSNMPTAVRINSQTADDPFGGTPSEAIFLNNTFNANGIGIDLEAPQPDPTPNFYAHNHVLTMDNIFANSTTAAELINGQAYGTEGEYNLYFNDPTFAGGSYVNRANAVGFLGDYQPVVGNPMFTNAATGDFSLQPGSAAIDESRSELGPSSFGLSLEPIADQILTAEGGVRNDTGRDNYGGGFVLSAPQGLNGNDIVSLPGYPLREQQPFPPGFEDEWVPAIPGSPGAIAGPTSNAGNVFSYSFTTGERDQSGNLRVKDPNSPNVGFGSRPFFDIGAYEYVILNPPHITAVSAVESGSTGATTTVPFYNAGGIVGANQTPQSIVLQFDKRLDPATVNSMTVLLEVAGVNGVFDPSTDKFINLSGKLAYDPNTDTVSVNLATSGLALVTDTYRLIVYGSGGNVIRDLQGEALDGENTNPLSSDQPDNPTTALPSGDGRPGGNFYLTFTIDTNAPTIVPGTFSLAADSDTGASGDDITKDNRPNFVGQITDVPPPANPLLGDTVEIDVSTKGDGVFDMLDVASGITNAAGFFTATYNPNSKSLPDSVVTIGPSGILGNADNTGFSLFRVRVVNTAGNQSSVVDPNAQLKVDIDTTPPRVLAASPLNNSNATNTSGIIPVSIVVNENLLPSSLTTSSIQVVRTAGSGGFGAGAAAVAIDPASLTIQNLPSATGEEVIHFNIIGASATDIYQVTLDGVGTTAVTDVAGNALDGTFNGTFPTGTGTSGESGNFVFQFIVYNPTTSHILYVNNALAASAAPTGTIENPYPTITAALTAATPGDTVAVLPGVYTESITLKSLVKLVSASTSSTDTQYLPGVALQTIIRAPANAALATTTVTGNNLISIPGLMTEISGFSIASPLNGNSANGPIVVGSAAILLTQSNILVDRNYILDSYIGVGDGIGSSQAVAATFDNNVFVGNYIGLLVNDQGLTGFQRDQNVQINNNDFAYNTYGYDQVTTLASGPVLAGLSNNIFYENRDNTTARNGAAIVTSVPNRMTVQYNLFYGNGPSEVSPADDTLNVGGGFNPSLLPTNGTTPDSLGNLYGNPQFITSIDPRPDASGPGNFFLGANFDLKLNSAAVDEALEGAAPTTDFRFRTRVAIPGRGRTGTGPADIGAFEYNGGGGVGTGVVGSTGGSSGTSGTSNTDSANSGTTPGSGTGTGTTTGGSTTSTGGGTTTGGSTTSTGGSSSSTTLTGPTSTIPLTKAQKLKAKRAAAAAAAAAKRAAARAAAAEHKAAKATHAAAKPKGPMGLINKFRRTR